MLVTYISGSELIGRIDHDLNLDNSDWIAKAPLWIANAIAMMDILPASQDSRISVSIVDYQCFAPLNINLLQRITINNNIVTLCKNENSKFVDDVESLDYTLTYSVRGDTASLNTIITFGIESGTAIFYYKVPAVEVVNEYNIVMPKVINDIFVIETIKWFIMIQILQNGYIHSVFNLTSNNPFTNVGMLWKEYQNKARNSVGTMNQDERLIFSNLGREFIKNYEYYYNEGFR